MARAVRKLRYIWYTAVSMSVMLHTQFLLLLKWSACCTSKGVLKRYRQGERR